MTVELRLSVVMPAHEEGEHIVPHLDRIFESVHVPCEVIVVCDSAEDITLPYLVKYRRAELRLRHLLNAHGTGAATAIRSGIEAALAPVVVVTMADGSDDVDQIERMTRLVERGAVIAAASRYSAGGQQIGAPFLKRTLSRAAGLSLFWLGRVGTHDATNSFKAYSKSFIDEVGLHASAGFEMGIELVAKARRLRLPVAEVPTIWLEREHGVSHFKVVSWLPNYIRWYALAFGPRLSMEELLRRCDRIAR